MERCKSVKAAYFLPVNFNQGLDYEHTKPQSSAVCLVNLVCDRRRLPGMARGVRGIRSNEGWNPNKPFFSPGKKLRVQPVFMYSLPTPKEAASWKSWGGVQTEPAVIEECGRIDAELKQLTKQAEFGLEILPLAKVTTAEAAQKLAGAEWDVTLVYACTGGGAMLRACLELKPDTLVFVRHSSGPIYYWYEALSTRYLRTDSPGSSSPIKSRHRRAPTWTMWWWTITPKCSGNSGPCTR